MAPIFQAGEALPAVEASNWEMLLLPQMELPLFSSRILDMRTEKQESFPPSSQVGRSLSSRNPTEAIETDTKEVTVRYSKLTS